MAYKQLFNTLLVSCGKILQVLQSAQGFAVSRVSEHTEYMDWDEDI